MGSVSDAACTVDLRPECFRFPLLFALLDFLLLWSGSAMAGSAGSESVSGAGCTFDLRPESFRQPLLFVLLDFLLLWSGSAMSVSAGSESAGSESGALRRLVRFTFCRDREV